MHTLHGLPVAFQWKTGIGPGEDATFEIPHATAASILETRRQLI